MTQASQILASGNSYTSVALFTTQAPVGGGAGNDFITVRALNAAVPAGTDRQLILINTWPSNPCTKRFRLSTKRCR